MVVKSTVLLAMKALGIPLVYLSSFKGSRVPAHLALSRAHVLLMPYQPLVIISDGASSAEPQWPPSVFHALLRSAPRGLCHSYHRIISLTAFYPFVCLPHWTMSSLRAQLAHPWLCSPAQCLAQKRCSPFQILLNE